MITAETLWLRSQAAQQNFVQIANYNSAFVGTAMIQAVQMSIAAPHAFWTAVGRASAVPANAPATTAPKPAAKAAPAKAKAKAKPVAAKPVAQAKPKPIAVAEAREPAAKLVAVETPKAAPKPVAVAAPKEATTQAPSRVAEPKPAAKSAPAAKPAPAPKPAAKAAPAPTPVVKAVAKAAPKPAPKPAPKAAPKAVVEAKQNPILLDQPRGGKADDLTTLAGVGPKLASVLNEFGIYHYDQLAGLNADGIDWIDEQQKGFKMLSARYDIVGQAKAVS